MSGHGLSEAVEAGAYLHWTVRVYGVHGLWHGDNELKFIGDGGSPEKAYANLQEKLARHVSESRRVNAVAAALAPAPPAVTHTGQR